MFDKATQKHPDAKHTFFSDGGFRYIGNVFNIKIEESGMTRSISKVEK